MNVTHYTRSRTWVSAAGRRVSFYGALPWWSEAQKIAEGWRLDIGGWIPAWSNGTVGACRVPDASLDIARARYGAEAHPEWTDAA